MVWIWVPKWLSARWSRSIRALRPGRHSRHRWTIRIKPWLLVQKVVQHRGKKIQTFVKVAVDRAINEHTLYKYKIYDD